MVRGAQLFACDCGVHGLRGAALRLRLRQGRAEVPGASRLALCRVSTRRGPATTDAETLTGALSSHRGYRCRDAFSATAPSSTPMGLGAAAMPSFAHDALLEIFRRRPTLAPELLRDGLHIPMPLFAQVEVVETSVTEILPTDRKADLVLLFSDSPGGLRRCALVVEVQLAVDPEKRRSWWWYLVGIHTRHRCDAVLVVVTPSARVAGWARKPIALGHPGASLTPIVIGPDAVPVIREAAEASLSPELAVLSAVVHGRSEAAEDVAKAAFAAVRGLDEERAVIYTDVVLASVHAAARAVLEDLMANGTYQFQSDFMKRHLAKWREEGLAKGREEGREQGREQGFAEGEARGRGLAALAILSARGIKVPPSIRRRVLACTDVATLDTWIARAVTAKAASDVITK
jgi:hypothetical protein